MVINAGSAGQRGVSSRSRYTSIVFLLSAMTLGGCASVTEPRNVAIDSVDEGSGYRRLALTTDEDAGDTLIMLAFSGGGTRAAALSYGVMQELRDTMIDAESGRGTVLSQVDSISSVSGGSFTAAYYGLFRDRLFTTYESDFLRRSVQSSLIRRLLSPGHWFKSTFSGFDRTEMAIDYYDRTIFRGATFDDIRVNGPPYIDINASDLTTGLRFTFSQELFDLICTDLGSFPVARAVTASSAVPVVFPPVVLKNHADRCDLSDTIEWDVLVSKQPTNLSQEKLFEGLKSFRDAEQRSYIHLVDGGISDNLGLRTMIDRMEGLGEMKVSAHLDSLPDSILLVLVNAETNPQQLIESSAKKPSAAGAMQEYVDSQTTRYNAETLSRMREILTMIETRSRAAGRSTKVHFAEINFAHIQEKQASTFLNSTPTTLELGDTEIDRVIAAGRILLRSNPDFQVFLGERNGSLSNDAPDSKTLCTVFDVAGCGE